MSGHCKCWSLLLFYPLYKLRFLYELRFSFYFPKIIASQQWKNIHDILPPPPSFFPRIPLGSCEFLQSWKSNMYNMWLWNTSLRPSSLSSHIYSHKNFPSVLFLRIPDLHKQMTGATVSSWQLDFCLAGLFVNDSRELSEIFQSQKFWVRMF